MLRFFFFLLKDVIGKGKFAYFATSLLMRGQLILIWLLIGKVFLVMKIEAVCRMHFYSSYSEESLTANCKILFNL